LCGAEIISVIGPMEGSDYKLVQAIGDGNPEAFEQLVKRYQKSLFNFIYRYLGERSTAEDLTQEVFLRIFLAARRLEARPGVRYQPGYTGSPMPTYSWLRFSQMYSLQEDISSIKGFGPKKSGSLQDRDSELKRALDLDPF
jgi:hypothetical protein